MNRAGGGAQPGFAIMPLIVCDSKTIEAAHRARSFQPLDLETIGSALDLSVAVHLGYRSLRQS
jgi:hypothetical protein